MERGAGDTVIDALRTAILLLLLVVVDASSARVWNALFLVGAVLWYALAPMGNW